MGEPESISGSRHRSTILGVIIQIGKLGFFLKTTLYLTLALARSWLMGASEFDCCPRRLGDLDPA